MSAVTRIRTNRSLTVPHTAEVIWEVLADVARYQEWWPVRFGVQVLEAPKSLLGTVIEVRPRLGRTFRCRFEEVQEPRSIRIRFFGGVLEGPCYLVLDSLEESTRVRLEIDVYARGLGVAALSFIFPFERLHSFHVRRLLRALQHRLKALSAPAARDLKTAVASAEPATPLSVPAPAPPSIAAIAPPPREVLSNLDLARQYLEALSSSLSPAEITRYFHKDATEEEFPNPFLPEGAARNLDGIVDARMVAQAHWTRQRFEMRGATSGGSQVAVEVLWVGTAAHHSEELIQGQTVEARLALFLKFRDRKIVRQRVYRSFEPLGADSLDADADSTASEPVVAQEDGRGPQPPSGTNFEIARLYLDALSNGQGPDEVARFFARDAIQELLASPLHPRGARHNLAGIRSAREAWMRLFPTEMHDLQGAAGGSSKVALEVDWTGVSGVDRAHFRKGQEVRCRSAVFLKFRDGLIVRQRNYDCVAAQAPTAAVI